MKNWLWLLMLVAPDAVFADAHFEGLMARAHSHNDYEQRRPLHEAIDAGFSSVEADIRYRNGDVWISHSGFSWKGTLRALYLDPLQLLIDRRGSVHGDGKTFYLWLDLKESGADLRRELKDVIARYSMFKSTAPAVQLILTGSDQGKRKLVEEPGGAIFIRDSNSFSAKDPHADAKWQWYALKWSSYVSWDGDEPPSSVARNRLLQLVQAIHAKGRKVRFYAVPETAHAWRLLVESGADHISTDFPANYRKFAEEETYPQVDKLSDNLAVNAI